MKEKASSYRCWSSTIVGAAAAVAVLAQPAPARADDVPATGKGIVGGALLGGEVVVIGEAIAGVKPGWAYAVGAVIGAGGGAFAGWEVEQNADSKVSLYMLAGGMALLIPATVAALQATSYQPPSDYTEDRPSVGAPIPEPPQPSQTPPGPSAPSGPGPGQSSPGVGAPPPGASPAPAGPTSFLHMHWEAAKLKLPAGLLAVDDGALRVAVPAMEIKPTYRTDELQKYGLEQKQELHFALLSSRF
jgi:hypothetical protein